MSWWRQAVHVAAKDVRYASLHLFAYTLLVAVATAYAIVRPTLGSGWLWSMLVMVSGVVIFALLIHGDSPSRPDAFWRTRPLDPLAVLTAKLMVGALLVTIGLAGQWLALRAYNVSGGDLVRLLTASALAWSFLLVAAGLVATVTRDLPRFILVLLAIFVVAPIAVLFADVEPAPSSLAQAIFPLAALLIMAWHYRRRRTVPAAVATALLVTLTLVAPMLLPARTPPAPAVTGDATVPEELRLQITSVLPFTTVLAGARPVSDRALSVNLPLHMPDVPDGYRYRLRRAAAAVRTADGTDVAVPAAAGLRLLHRARPAIGEVTWLDHVGIGSGGASLTLEVTPAQRETLERGGAWLAIDAVIDVERAGEPVLMPPTGNPTVAVRGGRIRIDRAGMAPGSVRATITTVRAGEDVVTPFAVPGDAQPLSFLLVNRERTPIEAVMLRDMGGGGFGGLGLVLPGANPMVRTTDLQLSLDNGKLDAAWAGQAQLLAVEWVPVGSYAVRWRLSAASALRP